MFKHYPFTIILLSAVKSPQVQPLRINLDPGSQTTGISIVDDHGGQVLFAAELTHRGRQIKKALDTRRAVRHTRRAHHTRYRKPRFNNRSRPKGWLAPSLMSRVYNVLTWVNRLRRLCPIAAISMELVRFDPQAMEHPAIEGCQYQQGTLAGYEVREYLLEKWARTCVYCSKQHIPLQIEHSIPRAKGGTDRVSNLTLACEQCNRAKGTQDIAVFLKKKPEVLKRILAQAKAPLKDAAAVNGHGCRQVCLMDGTGFPRTKPKQKNFTHGFRTGDIIQARVPAHLNHAGIHVGRMSAKQKGGFTITTAHGKITDVGKKYCRVLQRADGYGYSQQCTSAVAFLSSLSRDRHEGSQNAV